MQHREEVSVRNSALGYALRSISNCLKSTLN